MIDIFNKILDLLSFTGYTETASIITAAIYWHIVPALEDR
jgi:hypothetical protein